MTLVETAVGCLLSTVVIFAITQTAQQSQKRLSAESSGLEMQQNGRAAINLISTYVRSAGADRAGIFSAAPYTTSSVLPIPSASSTSIRFLSDCNDNGAIAAAAPEDVSVSWTAATKTLSIGSAAQSGISSFTIRYYDSSGNELTPPSGGWNVASDATHGATLRSITRIQLELVMEARYQDPITHAYQHLTLTSDVSITNQLS